MQVVARWILASLRHRVFDTVAEADAAIQALLPSLNGRLFRKLPGSRASGVRHGVTSDMGSGLNTVRIE